MAKSDITKRALAESLKSLMRENPFTKITIEDICDTAGVSRRNFYRHFLDKYELLNWVYYEDFVKNVHAKNYERTIDLFPDVCNHLYSDRAFFVNAFDVKGQNSFRTYCTDRLYPYLERDFGSACTSDYAKKFYIYRIVDAVFDRFQDWLRSEPCMPPDEFSTYIIDSMRSFSKKFAEVNVPFTYSKLGFNTQEDPYITTCSGVHFHPLNPKKDEIRIRDIAHALSLICRASGHVKRFYSVGEHSIACYKEAIARGYSYRIQAGCLLHDASEAYLQDIPTPVKADLFDYIKIEDAVQNAIWHKYYTKPLTAEERACVSEIDRDMLAYEFRKLMPEELKGNYDQLLTDPIDEDDYSDPRFSINVDPKDVENEFLAIFDLISGMKH